MTVKANWNSVAMPLVDDSDPFADETPIDRAIHVPTEGLPIDVAAPKGKLMERLKGNMKEQGRLLAAGVDCELRWLPDANCHACPLFSAENRLCSLAREQEAISMILTVRAHGERRQ